MRMPGHDNSARRAAERHLDERTMMRRHPTNGERELYLDWLGTMHNLPRKRLTSYTNTTGAVTLYQNSDGSFPYLAAMDGPITP